MRAKAIRKSRRALTIVAELGLVSGTASAMTVDVKTVLFVGDSSWLDWLLSDGDGTPSCVRSGDKSSNCISGILGFLSAGEGWTNYKVTRAMLTRQRLLASVIRQTEII